MEEQKENDTNNIEDLKEFTQNFIASLSPSHFQNLDFKESLDVKLFKTGETIGTFEIDVKKKHVDEKEDNGIMFEVTAVCTGNVEHQVVCSFNAFAQLIYADGILRVVYQNHTELVKCGELQVNKVTETKLHADGTLEIKRRINDENESQIILTPEEARTYLSDGASLLLLRLMAQTSLTQRMAFITLDGDGQICPVLYYLTETPTTSNENVSKSEEEKSLINIVRELHRDEKIDDWAFCLFSTGELFSWTHTNSPVYMKCKSVSENNNENSLVNEAVEENSINMPETTVIGSTDSASEILQISLLENQMPENEQPEQTNVVENAEANAENENLEITENTNSSSNPSLSTLNEQTQQNLSTIDEEDEDLLSISQKNPIYRNGIDQQQNIAGGGTVMSTSGSTLHIRGLFEDVQNQSEPCEGNVAQNETSLLREQTFNSDSTMHIKGLFEETYCRNESRGLEEANVLQSVENFTEREKTNTSGSTMHLRGLFDVQTDEITSINNVINENQIEAPVEREETFTSGSTMHLRGLFAQSPRAESDLNVAREHFNTDVNKEVDFRPANQIENDFLLTDKGSATDRTTTSGSSYHLRGLFASYKSDLNFQPEITCDKTITRESTMDIHGLLDSTTNLHNLNQQEVKAIFENPNIVEETNESGFGNGENESGIASNNEETKDSSSLVEVYEKFVTDKFFPDSTTRNVGETSSQDFVNEVKNGPLPMPTLLSYIPRHVLLDNLYHHKPSPIPEEDEENMDQENSTIVETNEKNCDIRQNDDDDDNEEKTSAQEGAKDELTSVENSQQAPVDFPLELFDSNQSKGVLSRDNSLPFELEPQHNSPLNSARGFSKGSGIFPPIPSSPRGDKRMMKLMSRRLSALMTGLDNSIGDEPVDEESDKKDGDSVRRNDKKTDSARSVNKKERANKDAATNWNEKLDYQSDFNSFNRFTVLSRQSSQLVATPRNTEDNAPVETTMEINDKTKEIMNNNETNNDNAPTTNNEPVDQLDETRLDMKNLNIVVSDLQTQSPDDGMGSSDDTSARLSEKRQSFTFENFDDVQKFFKSECENYIENHPEIRKILGDFLQALLIARPDEILPFASSYFRFVANIKKD